MRHLVQVVDLGESVGEEWRLGKWMRTCRELKGTSAWRSVTNQRDQMLGNKSIIVFQYVRHCICRIVHNATYHGTVGVKVCISSTVVSQYGTKIP